jgi:hypothetical protein
VGATGESTNRNPVDNAKPQQPDIGLVCGFAALWGVMNIDQDRRQTPKLMQGRGTAIR